jgi:hypothetical protein
VRVLQQLRINHQFNIINICQEIDNQHIKKSEPDAEAISKVESGLKRTREGNEDPDDPEYRSGLHYGHTLFLLREFIL